MKTLFITNYQKSIPPFILNEMKLSNKCFDKVIYVNPKLKIDNRNDLILDNVFYCIGNVFDYFIGFLKFLIIIFSKSSFSNIFLGLRSKKNIFRFFVNHFHKLYNASVLSIILKRAYKKHKSEYNSFISCWFDSSALSFCFFSVDKRTKNSFYTFAHSYEVNPFRNKFAGISFDRQIVRKVKNVFFISKNVLDLYFNDNLISSILSEFKDKFLIRYLGVENPYDVVYKTSKVFTIVSVSSVIALKRVDRIIECLSNFDKPIKWVHIGNGPLLHEIKKIAHQKLSGNKCVEYEFLGHLPNTKVLQYLNDTPVDAFLNVSSIEGISVAIMEALSFGIPVIATDVGGTNEIIDDKVGLLLDETCPIKDLSLAINKIYSLSKQNRMEYFRNCRDKWNSLFNLEKNAYNFYNKL